MMIASHVEKFRRLDAAKRKLDPEDDRELWIWTAMNACTHLLNAALHRCAITDETDSFHTQVDGLYACPDRSSGDLRDAMHPPGDVIHVGQPPITALMPEAIARACATLRIIEDLRGPYVLGMASASADAVRTWERVYGECVSLLLSTLADDFHENR